jgi:membrane protein
MHLVRHPQTPGYRFRLAILVLRQLAAAREVDAHGVSAAKLSQALRVDPLQIEPILHTLVSVDWAGRLDEAGDPRYVLLCDPLATPARPLLEQLLIEPSPQLRGFWRRAGFEDMMLGDLLQA